VVVQDVDAAVRLGRLLDQALDLHILGDIELARFGAPAGIADAARGILGAFGDEVGRNDDRALASHDLGAAASDAGAGCGDDGDAILEDHVFLPRPFSMLSGVRSCAAAAIVRRTAWPARTS
jgi:hypothetical protein